MLKHIYKKGVLGALLIGLAACSTELVEEDNLTPSTTPIRLTGAVTRAEGSDNKNTNLDGYSGLYLSAKVIEGTLTKSFFDNSKVTKITTNSGNKTLSDLTTTVYYPLNKKTDISLYGHTGKVTNGKMNLTSGKASTNDALISNGTNGKGTAGNANNPVELLTFCHVMTKLEVAIEVDQTTGSAVEDPEPTDIKIQFGGTKVPKTGTYDITTSLESTNDANNKATATDTETYELSVGTHYLVPTGENLTGQNTITSLKIDDYTATAADLAALTIPQADKNGTKSDLVLKPGLAYKLTFVIKRLKVTGIELTMQDWNIKTGNGGWDYTPKQVKMNLTGGYNNSRDKLLSKIILHYTNNDNTYQYIGKGEKAENGNDVYAKFLTLPANMTQGTMTADLYTQNGLLIEGYAVTYSTDNGGQFNITLGANGMVKNTAGYYQVNTPLQFYNLISNPGSDSDNANEKKYILTKNIDLSHLSLAITPCDFPTGGELDGNGHSILHLDLKGGGLFKENKGTLKNIHIAFSSIDATASSDTYVGGICSINSGTIEGCINEANVEGKMEQTVGGICGKNSGKVLACLNTGDIPLGTAGGICGENASNQADAIKACINAGLLHGSSNCTGNKPLGGICGYQSATSSSSNIINACYWLTGTASHDQEYNDELAIGSIKDVSDAELIIKQANYCSNTTNMTETKLRTEAVTKLNQALGSQSWEFKWEVGSDGTCQTVWPIPVKKTTTTP